MTAALDTLADRQAALNAASAAAVASYQALHQAWDNLLIALGSPLVGPATDLLTRGTVALTGLGQWAAKYPGLVGRLEEVTAGLAGLAVVGGSLTIAGAALAPFTGSLRAFVGVMGGGEMATATTAAAALGGGSLLGVAGGLVALSAAVIGLPPMLHAAVTGLNEMLGIKDNPDASGRAGQAQAREYLRTHDGPPIPGVTPRSPESWHDWWNRETAGQAPHQQLRGGAAATMQPQSYAPTGTPDVAVRPISYVPPPRQAAATIIPITVQMDGRTVASVVTRHQENAASRAPMNGITGFDGRQSMTPPGMITA